MPNIDDVQGYVVFHEYKGMPTTSLLKDKCTAEAYCVKYHGTLFPLEIPQYAKPPVVVEEMKVLETGVKK